MDPSELSGESVSEAIDNYKLELYWDSPSTAYVEYMVRCEPQIIEMINNKNKNGTAENGSPKNYAKNGNIFK